MTALPTPIVINDDSMSTLASDHDDDDDREHLSSSEDEYDADNAEVDSPLFFNANDDVRQRRRKEERAVPRLRRYAAAGFLYVMGIILACAGIMEIIAAERERKHGWELAVCHIEQDFGHNDSQCIYFGARLAGNKDSPVLCAVPASISASASFIEPPACHGDTFDNEIAHWRSIRSGSDVECLVPTSIGYAVSLQTCVASTTGGHSVAAVVWRTWIERLVYLTRTPREGIAATEAITGLRTKTGIGLLAVGSIVIVGITVCVCLCCQPPAPVVFARRRHDRRMATHKMY